MTRKVIIISSGYLDSFKEQLSSYTLELCLFGSGVNALKNLPCINKLDLLGCIIADNVIDKTTLNECLPFLKTLQQVYNVPITIAFNTLENKSVEATLLKIPKVTMLPFELFTDTIIDMCMQSVLLKQGIYKLKDDSDVTASRLPKQSLHRLLDDNALYVLQPVVNTNSLANALMYEKIRTDNETVGRLRKGYIAQKYNSDVGDLTDIYEKSPSLFETLYAKYLSGGGGGA